jgi:hypothetical protein
LNAFFGKKWPIRILVMGLVVGVLSALPKIPHDQTLRIDLGDSSKITRALTLRWVAVAALAEHKKREPSIEDWTGEVTFRYEKNAAPRVVEHEARLADGDYVVEIEVSTDDGRANAVTRRAVALHGGATTIDVASLVHTNDLEDGGAK